MIITAYADIFIGQKSLPPRFDTSLRKRITPSKNVLMRLIRVNFTFWVILIWLLGLNSKFVPRT